MAATAQLPWGSYTGYTGSFRFETRDLGGVTPGLYPTHIQSGTDGQIYHSVLHFNFFKKKKTKPKFQTQGELSTPRLQISPPRKQHRFPGKPAASLPRLTEAACNDGGAHGSGWRAGLTFTLPAFPLVAWLAEAFVGLGRVLADGINVAVVCALRAFVHVDGPCWRGNHE